MSPLVTLAGPKSYWDYPNRKSPLGPSALPSRHIPQIPEIQHQIPVYPRSSALGMVPRLGFLHQKGKIQREQEQTCRIRDQMKTRSSGAVIPPRTLRR